MKRIYVLAMVLLLFGIWACSAPVEEKPYPTRSPSAQVPAESGVPDAQAQNPDEFFVLPGEYVDLYASQEQAMDAVLRPLKNVLVKQILDESWQDGTGLLAWLGKPEPSFLPQPMPTEEPATLEDFILQGRNREYAYEELDAYTQEEIALVRNGMYALSGKIFNKQENSEYFSQCSWYFPVAKDVDSLLNGNQRANIDLCVQYEKDHEW